MLRDAVHGYSAQDAEGGRNVLRDDDAVDALYGQLIQSVVAKTSKQHDMMGAYLDILSVAKNLERIADHATNIAEDVIFLATGEIVRHQSQ